MPVWRVDLDIFGFYPISRHEVANLALLVGRIQDVA